MTTLRMRAATPLRFSLLALAVSASAARAATVNWVSISGGSWTLASNWSSSPTLPGPGDDVTITANSAITVGLTNTSQSIQSLLSNNTITLSNSTLSVTNSIQINNGGTLNVNNATLQNANLFVPGTGVLNSNGGTFSNVTLTASNLNTSNNISLNGNLTLNSSGYYANVYINNSESITGSGAIYFNGTYGSGGTVATGTGSPTLTIAPGILLATGTGPGTVNVSSIVNQGTISAETAGKTFSIAGINFTNGGLIRALNGATLNLNASNWSSTGTIALDSTSTINLGGTFSTASLANISRTGGTINLNGTLDNTNSNLLVGSTTGDLVLVGTIKNGTIGSAAGGKLVPNSGTLSNVGLSSDLTLTAGPLAVTNNLSLGSSNLTLDSTGYYANFFLSGNQTISGNGAIVFNGNYGSGGYIGGGAGATTIGPGVTLKTGNGNGSLSNSAFINQGTIAAQTTGTSFSISTNTFTNTGTLKAINGGTLNLNSNSWTNSGTIQLDSLSTLNLGGNFATASLAGLSRSGGTVNITGTLDNSNATLALTASTGSMNLNGTIKNGSVTLTGGAQLLINNGSLNNVTLGSDLTLSNNDVNTLNNFALANATLTLNSATYYANIWVTSSETFSGTGAIVFNGSYGAGSYISYSGSSTLTIAPGLTLKTGNGNASVSAAALTNQGVLSAETAGKSFSVTTPGNTFTNTGTVQAINGANFSLSNAPANFAGGILTGGTWIVSNSTLRVPANIITNNANIVLDGATANIYNAASGTTSALGGLATNAGNLTITNGQILTTALSFTNTGTLVVGPNARLGAGQVTLNGGLLAGTGTVFKSVVAGNAPHMIHPGMPGSSVPGTLTTPSLSTNGNTTLAFNLVSPDTASTPSVSDQLNLTDKFAPLTIGGGNIQVTSTGGAASLGYYRIIQVAGPITGSLSSLLLPAPVNHVVYTLDTAHDAGFIDLHRGFLGDANDDGRIDLTDLAIVLNHFGTATTAWSDGNFDGAATVGTGDVSSVLNNFGSVLSNGFSAPSTVAAPEPASLALLIPAVLLRRRRAAG